MQEKKQDLTDSSDVSFSSLADSSDISFSSLASVFGCLSNVEHQERAIQLKTLQEELLVFKHTTAIHQILPLMFRSIPDLEIINEFLLENKFPQYIDIKFQWLAFAYTPNPRLDNWFVQMSKYSLEELLPLFKFVHSQVLEHEKKMAPIKFPSDLNFKKWFVYKGISLLP